MNTNSIRIRHWYMDPKCPAMLLDAKLYQYYAYSTLMWRILPLRSSLVSPKTCIYESYWDPIQTLRIQSVFWSYLIQLKLTYIRSLIWFYAHVRIFPNPPKLLYIRTLSWSNTNVKDSESILSLINSLSPSSPTLSPLSLHKDIEKQLRSKKRCEWVSRLRKRWIERMKRKGKEGKGLIQKKKVLHIRNSSGFYTDMNDLACTSTTRKQMNSYEQ